jgi:plastocyanin
VSRRRARRAAGVGLALAAVSVAVPAALADSQMTAVVRDQYGASSYTIDQGQTISFANNDIDSHNVSASGKGPDGNPLFQSDTIGTGQSTGVAGTQYLTSGSYSFICTVHPFMHATLVVTSAGTPVPRPGGSSGSPGGSPGSSPSAPAGPAPVVVSSPSKGKKHAKHRKKHRRRSHRGHAKRRTGKRR